MTPRQIYLMRHGETQWTLSGQHTGKTDIPLTPNGEKTALSLKERLKECVFEKVLTSPLQRARTTCAIAGFFRAETDPDLAEWDYGSYEGLTTPEIRQHDPGWNIFQQGAPGGEAPSDVAKRVQRVLEKVDAYSGDVAIFSHGHFLRALIAGWLQLPISEGRLFLLSPLSLSILGYEHGVRVLALLNEV